MEDKASRVRTPIFPTYSEVRQLITIFDGICKSDVIGLINAVNDQRGTPQNPVDWSEPDTWIKERLNERNAELASFIWRRSNQTINPRHIYGSYLFINGFKLLETNDRGIYKISEKGRGFLDNASTVIREIDEAEGIFKLLSILSTKPQAQRKDLLPEWGEYLHSYSKFGKASTIADTLARRLRNLEDRGLVSREGITWSITESGHGYLNASSKGIRDTRRKVTVAVSNHNNKQLSDLRERLSTMDPYLFEGLVKDLLEAMGYEDVEVTKASGDKGVDVVANVQFGITTITEVVQVKRHKGNIGRPTLDQLRGALPYHKAIRGTLITLGNFSKGCKEAALYPGAAPIGLINGDKLIDLMVEHEIGIKRQSTPIYEVDADYFASTELTEEPPV